MIRLKPSMLSRNRSTKMFSVEDLYDLDKTTNEDDTHT